MIRQQPVQFFAMSDWIGSEIGARAEFIETLARSADTRAFKVVHVEIGQQMNARRERHDFDLAPAVVSDKRLIARGDQQIKRIVIAPVLRADKTRGLSRS